jgi:hypothetical protein
MRAPERASQPWSTWGWVPTIKEAPASTNRAYSSRAASLGLRRTRSRRGRGRLRRPPSRPHRGRIASRRPRPPICRDWMARRRHRTWSEAVAFVREECVADEGERAFRLGSMKRAAAASARFLPAPTMGRPAFLRSPNVSLNASGPKSRAWLLPKSMRPKPASLRAAEAPGGMEAIPLLGIGFAARRDGALEVGEGQVRLAQGLDDIAAKEAADSRLAAEEGRALRLSDLYIPRGRKQQGLGVGCRGPGRRGLYPKDEAL